MNDISTWQESASVSRSRWDSYEIGASDQAVSSCGRPTGSQTRTRLNKRSRGDLILREKLSAIVETARGLGASGLTCAAASGLVTSTPVQPGRR
jgi:hypothetical protein